MAEHDVKIESTFSRIRIKISGVVHLSLKQSNDLQVQSWLFPDKKYYAIEYYSCGATILCEYYKINGSSISIALYFLQ